FSLHDALPIYSVSSIWIVFFVYERPSFFVINTASGTIKISSAIMVGYVFSFFVINDVIVIAIPYRAVISSVRHIINYTMTINWRGVIHVPRTINIIWIVHIYNASAM